MSVFMREQLEQIAATDLGTLRAGDLTPALAAYALSLLDRAEKAEAEQDDSIFEEIGRGACSVQPSFEDERVRYVEVQIERDDWERGRARLAARDRGREARSPLPSVEEVARVLAAVKGFTYGCEDVPSLTDQVEREARAVLALFERPSGPEVE